jgi:hypothetical protein
MGETLSPVIPGFNWSLRVEGRADRLDAKMLTMVVYEHDHLFRRRSRSAAAKKADALRRMSLTWRSSRISR